MNVGIIGCGMVGETVARWLERHDHAVVRHDPPKGWDREKELDDCQAVFVCVPTPFQERKWPHDAYGDMSLVRQSILYLRGHKIVVIKSTVLPGTTDELSALCQQHTIFFVPEFLSEATADSDYAAPLVNLVGINEFTKRSVKELTGIIPNGWTAVPNKAAETYKLLRNAFAAVKVIFFNEMYDLAEKVKVDYSQLRNLAFCDPWIRGNHTDPLHGGYRGYGGKCLPKDMKALIAFGESLGVELGLLKAAEIFNAHLRERT